ncbi:hypothetical protein BOTBODRAFT_142545 [Botryobasidium botryosum FD-172 SS1]|uniref:Uncharacterized protein n=1 Tax=Botryobasidium botryosum (strain FD-172 SS1) TaxID=930990 RepID=A0A067MVW3_BOTB1|nr:hypothetical protein BOTBODRAFT_142545 [Botryobasidium botryosum FD-172 SS1]
MVSHRAPQFPRTPTSPTDSEASYHTALSSPAPGRMLDHLFTQVGDHIEHVLSAIPRASPKIDPRVPPRTTPEDVFKSRGAPRRPDLVPRRNPSREEKEKDSPVSTRAPAAARLVFLDQNVLPAMKAVDDRLVVKTVFFLQTGDLLNLASHYRPARNVQPREPYKAPAIPSLILSPPTPCKDDPFRESWVESSSSCSSLTPPLSSHNVPPPSWTTHMEGPAAPAPRSPSLLRRVLSRNTLRPCAIRA